MEKKIPIEKEYNDPDHVVNFVSRKLHGRFTVTIKSSVELKDFYNFILYNKNNKNIEFVVYKKAKIVFPNYSGSVLFNTVLINKKLKYLLFTMDILNELNIDSGLINDLKLNYVYDYYLDEGNDVTLIGIKNKLGNTLSNDQLNTVAGYLYSIIRLLKTK